MKSKYSPHCFMTICIFFKVIIDFWKILFDLFPTLHPLPSEYFRDKFCRNVSLSPSARLSTKRQTFYFVVTDKIESMLLILKKMKSLQLEIWFKRDIKHAKWKENKHGIAYDNTHFFFTFTAWFHLNDLETYQQLET